MSAVLRFAKAVIPEGVKESRSFKLATHVIRSHNAIYTQEYYAHDVESAAAQSAGVMARSIFDSFNPSQIIDVGCGTGALLEAFRILGCHVRGLEYSDAGIAYCRQRKLEVEKFNIEKDQFTANKEFDLAVSFEVAEHLPIWRSDKYVDLLCQLAPLVVMSAATPGQGGHDHVNEQPHSYWIEKFHQRGYAFEDITSARFSVEWKTAEVADWYYDNVMVFKRR